MAREQKAHSGRMLHVMELQLQALTIGAKSLFG